MFNLLCDITNITWAHSLFKCVHTFCLTAILITVSILIFLFRKEKAKNNTEKEEKSNRDKTLLEKLNICRCDNCPKKDESPDNTPKNSDKNNDKK